MSQSSILTTPTERVVARLLSEGWVPCSGLGFQALCQHHLPDLSAFVLERLHQEEHWLWEVDLQLETLVFSIADHEFQFHPQLKGVLKQLERQRMIEFQEFEKPTGRRVKTERAILLRTADVA